MTRTRRPAIEWRGGLPFGTSLGASERLPPLAPHPSTRPIEERISEAQRIGVGHARRSPAWEPSPSPEWPWLESPRAT